MDITPLIPEGRQIIESYGDGRFRVSGARIDGSALVFPTRAVAWAVADVGALTADSLAEVIAAARAGEVDLLLLGCGVRAALIPQALRATLRAAGIVVEAMDTGAACRTYNVLMAEGRRVAAALIAVA
ncbi:MAG: Mth938-like domain-containing protein [Rhodospirillaceae bacterium]|nr:Mth938-like domain-containing protein [Rhodospirillaceae bacterium]